MEPHCRSAALQALSLDLDMRQGQLAGRDMVDTCKIEDGNKTKLK